MDETTTYIATLIINGKAYQRQEFEALTDAAAWRQANEGVDPLQGRWIEVRRKPDPQQDLRLE
ncbi:MAG: hypothetical protein AB2807_09970 [Candidatus Sedimenticola endophacoides]